MVGGLHALPLHIFLIQPDEWPPGADRARDGSCHCALGSMDQVLAACGVDVDAELPWIRPWFERYQMRDGGLNCDASAYLVHDECPSSMVGTVAPFEAMLPRGDGPFVERAAAFLIDRQLRLGSATRHNAEEHDAARVDRADVPAILLLRRGTRIARARALVDPVAADDPARRDRRCRARALGAVARWVHGNCVTSGDTFFWSRYTSKNCRIRNRLRRV